MPVILDLTTKKKVKNIFVIGGGLSGMTLMHHLKKFYLGYPQVKLFLYEKNNYAGGTVKTDRTREYIFEYGPNGFLSSKESTMHLVHDLGLARELIMADSQAKKRFISLGHKLYEVPMDPVSFLRCPLLSHKDKRRILEEWRVPAGEDPGESVYAFGCRRLGQRFTEIFLDALVTGIFAGDTQSLCLKEAFPRIYELEQTHGSLFKAAWQLWRRNRKSKEAAPLGGPRGTLLSLQLGMGHLIDSMYVWNQDSIYLNQDVISVSRHGEKFVVETPGKRQEADEVFVCTPAYAASRILKTVDSSLAEDLAKIAYVPIAVVGLGFTRSAFKRRPSGFGYLIPSSEKKPVLGCLLPNNIFPEQVRSHNVFLRVMLGGSRYPEIIHDSQENIYHIAQQEVGLTYGIKEKPLIKTMIQWPRAIPQYNLDYPAVRDRIAKKTAQIPGLYLCANYLGGISVNDCTANARLAAERTLEIPDLS